MTYSMKAVGSKTEMKDSWKVNSNNQQESRSQQPIGKQ